jgi:membrane fusion protein (multidrug efflux system)
MADNTTSHTWNVRAGIVIICVAAALITTLIIVVFHPGYETTNDAQIDGHIHPLNARIGGTIIWVNPEIEDTHFVKAGTILARLDPNDYQPIVDRLQGDVQSNAAQWRTSELNVPVVSATVTSRLAAAQAGVRDAEAELSTAQAQHQAAIASLRQIAALYDRAEHDRARYEALFVTHDISRSEYEQRSTDALSLGEQREAARASLEAAKQRIASAEQRLAQRRSDLDSAETAPQQIAS